MRVGTFEAYAYARPIRGLDTNALSYVAADTSGRIHLLDTNFDSYASVTTDALQAFGEIVDIRAGQVPGSRFANGQDGVYVVNGYANSGAEEFTHFALVLTEDGSLLQEYEDSRVFSYRWNNKGYVYVEPTWEGEHLLIAEGRDTVWKRQISYADRLRPIRLGGKERFRYSNYENKRTFIYDFNRSVEVEVLHPNILESWAQEYFLTVGAVIGRDLLDDGLLDYSFDGEDLESDTLATYIAIVNQNSDILFDSVVYRPEHLRNHHFSPIQVAAGMVHVAKMLPELGRRDSFPRPVHPLDPSTLRRLAVLPKGQAYTAMTYGTAPCLRYDLPDSTIYFDPYGARRFLAVPRHVLFEGDSLEFSHVINYADTATTYGDLIYSGPSATGGRTHLTLTRNYRPQAVIRGGWYPRVDVVGRDEVYVRTYARNPETSLLQTILNRLTTQRQGSSSVADVSPESELRVVPNPATAFFSLAGRASVRPARVRVYSVTGQLLTERSELAIGERVGVDLPAGVYGVEIVEAGGARGSQSLVIGR